MNDPTDTPSSNAADVSKNTPDAPSAQTPPSFDRPAKPCAPKKSCSCICSALLGLVAFAALGLSGWQWYEAYEARVSGGGQDDLRTELLAELDKRASAIDEIRQEKQTFSKQSDLLSLQGRVGSLQDELTALRSKVAEDEKRLTAYERRLAGYESRAAEPGRPAAVEPPGPGLARASSEQDLSDIEHSVVWAERHLRLTGNAQDAILALQSADALLAKDAQFAAIRQALARDMERLRKLPAVDLAGINARLENVINALDTLPLLADARARGNPPAAQTASADEGQDAPIVSWAYWKQAGQRLWNKGRSLVRIERIDRKEATLLAPEQHFILRENIKLRLLSARIALLSSSQPLFKSDTLAAIDGIERYFDGGASSVQTTRETLRQLSATLIHIDPPTLDESLSAIRNFKTGKENQ